VANLAGNWEYENNNNLQTFIFRVFFMPPAFKIDE